MLHEKLCLNNSAQTFIYKQKIPPYNFHKLGIHGRLAYFFQSKILVLMVAAFGGNIICSKFSLIKGAH